MAVPPPNPVQDANGLTVVRYFVKEDPVFADTDNRPLSDLNQRDIDLYNFIDNVRSLCRASARSTPNNTVLVSAGYITWAGGRKRQTIANDFALAITFPPVSLAGQKRIDVLGINTAVTPVVPIRVQGVEDPTTPQEPVYPEWVLPLANIFVDETATVIVNEVDITDVRPVLQVPGSVLPCGTVLDVMYQPGIEVQLNGFLPAIGTFTIGNVGSGASFEGDIYEPLYNRLKTSQPNLGTEVFANGDLVVIPDWTERISIGRNTLDAEIDAIGKDAGSFVHGHTVDSHVHGIGNHVHPQTPHTHPISTQAAVNTGADNLIGAAGFYDAEGDNTRHNHQVPAHNHGGVTGLETPVNTGVSTGNTDATAPNTNNVTQKPKVKTVYKIVKF